MKRFLDLVPYLVIAYGIYGLIWRRDAQMLWNLPPCLWYVMGISTAVIVLIINWLDKKEHP